MKHIWKGGASTAMILALTACNGSNGATGTMLFASDVGTAAQALDAGETLSGSARTTSAANVNFDTGETGLTTADVSIKKNDQGGVTLTVDGVEQVFTSAEISPDGYGYNIEDAANRKYVALWTWNNSSANAAIDPSNPNYAQMWEYSTNQVDPTGQPNKTGFVVVGTETKPDVVASLPTASYTGRMAIKASPNSGFVNPPTSTTQIKGDVSMTADFGAGQVSGTVDALTIRDPGTTTDVAAAGSIAMDPAAISGNGFSGSLTPSGSFAGPSGALVMTDGAYAGTFFGPAAEEVGGAITMQGTYDGTAVNGVGGYTASQ